MEFHFLSFAGLVVCAAYFFAGFVDAICGGGGLVTVPALLAIGIPPHLLMGTNQTSTIFGSFCALYTYIKNKKIHFFSAFISLPFAIVGAYLGSDLNMIIPERSLQILMLVMVPILAVVLVLKKDLGEENHVDDLPVKRVVWLAMVLGFFLGLYQGFYGPGSGMLALFAYTFFLKLDMLRSNGNIKLVITASCVIAGLNYAMSGMIILKIVLLATISNIIGSRVGVKYALAKGTKGIRPIMFLVIAGLMVKIIADLL